MKTIKIQNENWRKLVVMKVHLACSSLDEVIDRLIKITEKMEPAYKFRLKKQEQKRK